MQDPYADTVVKETYQQYVRAIIIDMHIRFEDVKVKSWSQQATISVPLVAVSDEEAISYKESPEKLISTLNNALAIVKPASCYQS